MTVAQSALSRRPGRWRGSSSHLPACPPGWRNKTSQAGAHVLRQQGVAGRRQPVGEGQLHFLPKGGDINGCDALGRPHTCIQGLRPGAIRSQGGICSLFVRLCEDTVAVRVDKLKRKKEALRIEERDVRGAVEWNDDDLKSGITKFGIVNHS